jgi:NADP-dependent alcohol dehydrogenase
MQNFDFVNPVKILFGRGQIARVGEEIPPSAKILMLYGGGSIKQNGVYDQVQTALRGRELLEFGGIEANPRFETLMKAVELARKEHIGFLLSVGGGSVLDGTKFIAAAVPFSGDPWTILSKWTAVRTALPLASILTLPATGSEMNAGAVISRESTQEKLFFVSPQVFPKFSILDPETTFSLPARQVANGIVDAFVHVLEQYLTYPAGAPLQDRFAESILQTLIESAPRIIAVPPDYDARAVFMWCCTMALNGLISCGVPQDWTTHMIGHEITALHGLDHAQTLALVLPGVMTYQRGRKREKLLQYAARVWGIAEGSEDLRISRVIESTEKFFNSIGVKTRLSGYGLNAAVAEAVAGRFKARGGCKLGEHGDISAAAVQEILAQRV